MRYIRAFIYKIGLRPKYGSWFYSPSENYIRTYSEAQRAMHARWSEALSKQMLSKAPKKSEWP